MGLSSSTLGSMIDANLTSAGANGYNKIPFSTAVAQGIVMSIVGKSFATTDVGTVPGSGTGNGTGIVGLSSSNMVNTALGVMTSTGVNAQPLMQAIMTAVVSHLSSSATLSSSHTPVYLGTGTVNIGSIAVVTSEMASNIQSRLANAGAVGVNMPNLSLAIATGIVTEILAAGTGTVTITGSPSGTPSPGAGSGTGVIS